MSALAPHEAVAADLPHLLAVSESVGWPHTSDDWKAILESARVFAHRGAGGDLMSTGAVFPFDATLAAIGMIIVTPQAQGRGLARAMMQHCLRALGSPAPAFMLIATPQGRPLYEHLGFEVVDHIQKLVRGPRSHAAPHGHDVASLADADGDALHHLDRAAFGVDRRRALDARVQRRRGGAVLRDNGAVVGYGLSAPQQALVSVGPVVAPDTDGAAALVAHLAEEGRARIDVPVRQAKLIEALMGQGWERGEVAPVMLLGGSSLPGRREHLFAAASRAIC